MKKKYLTLIFLLFSFAVIAADDGQSELFSGFSLDIKSVQNPIFFIQNIGTGSSGKRGNSNWISMELNYKTLPARGTFMEDNVNMIGTSKHRFSIEFSVILAGTGGTYLLKNRVDYAGVKVNGNSKTAAVFIPPQILNAVVSRSQQINRVFFRRLSFRARFLINDKVSGEYYSPGSAEQNFESVESNESTTVIPGGLVSRKNSPWITIHFEKYQIIKS